MSCPASDSTTRSSGPSSTPSSIKTLRPETGSNSRSRLIDTSVTVEPGEVGRDIASGDVAVSTLTIGELEAGLRAAVDDLKKARRQRHLRDIERQTRALAFDLRGLEGLVEIVEVDG